MSYLPGPEPEHDPFAPPRAPIGYSNTSRGSTLGGDRPPADHIEGSPWVTVWTAPRSTIRTLLDTRPTYGVIPIGMVLGSGSGMAQLADPNGLAALSEDQSTGFVAGVLIGGTIVGALFGIVGIYIGGWIMRAAGARLNGRGTNAEVRAALAWGYVPTLPMVPILAACLLAFGRGFYNVQDPTGLGFAIYGGSSIFLGLWSFFAVLKTVGEAHRFSAWKSFGAGIVAFLALMGLGVLIAIFIGVATAVFRPA